MSSYSPEELFVIVCVGGSWKVENEECVYVRPIVKNFGVEFSSDICFSDLLELVKMKTGLGERPDISLSFQHPTSKYVMDIVDDRDLKHLKKVIRKVSTTLFLYVVDNDTTPTPPNASTDNRSSGRGSNNQAGIFVSQNPSENPHGFVAYGTPMQPMQQHQNEHVVFQNQYMYQQIHYAGGYQNNDVQQNYMGFHQFPHVQHNQFPQHPEVQENPIGFRPYHQQIHFQPQQIHFQPSQHDDPPHQIPTRSIPYKPSHIPPRPTAHIPPRPTAHIPHRPTAHIPPPQDHEYNDVPSYNDDDTHHHDVPSYNDDETQDQEEEEHENCTDIEEPKEGGDDEDATDDFCLNVSDLETDEKEIEKPVQIRDYEFEPFYGMPPIPKCPEEEERRPSASHSLNFTNSLKLLQLYENKKAFLLALGVKSVEEGYQFKSVRSTTKRFQGACIDQSCTWHISAVKLNDCDMFQVRKLNDVHTCSAIQLNPNHRQANKMVLGHIVADVLGRDHKRIYRGGDIQHDLSTRYNIHVTYKQAWRAKQYALSLLRGPLGSSFAKLPLYCYQLEQCNPGSHTYIKTDSEDRFEFLFATIGCTVRAFVNTCRRTIIIDGTHLKGEFKGTMLLAVAMDGNNQILPIAYGICKSECTESWSWFLEKLHDCIGDLEDLTFISDRAPSISAAISSIYPNAYHGICGHHLHMNVQAKFKKNVGTKSLLWKAIKAYKICDFDTYYNTIRRRKYNEWLYLQEADPRKWSRTHFPGLRYNMMTSNSAESINSLSKDARKLPVLMLLEFFRMTMQQWFYKRRNRGVARTTKLTPWADKKIAKRGQKANNWSVSPISVSRFEVLESLNNGKGIVDIEHRTCTCLKWQVSGLPCGHLINVLQFLRLDDCSDLALEAFHMDVYRQTYAEEVNPLPTPREWVDPGNLMTVRPPLMEKRQAGRPKANNRIPSQGEEPTVRRCSRCQQPGHTRLTCSSFAPSARPESSKRSGKTSSSKKGASTKKGASEDASESQNNFPTFDLNQNN